MSFSVLLVPQVRRTMKALNTCRGEHAERVVVRKGECARATARAPAKKKIRFRGPVGPVHTLHVREPNGASSVCLGLGEICATSRAAMACGPLQCADLQGSERVVREEP